MKLPPLGVTPAFHELDYIAPYTEAALDRWRTVGDPAADAIVATLAAEGPLTKLHDLLGTVRARAAGGDARCRALLAEAADVPPWVDWAAIARGQRVIATFAPFMAASLFAGSLVGGAMFLKAARVTAMTGMFAGKPTQRLTETVAMVMRMALPGSMEPGAPGHEVQLRVRLLHAGLRRFLVDSGRFRHPTEVPINQHDLAITLALFCYVNVRSLMQLGIRLPRADREGFFMLWRYAGHVLGIAPELLPTSLADQQAFFLASCKHQVRPELVRPETVQLLDAIADEAKVIPTRMARTFLHQITRYLAGGDYITGMQLADLGDYWGIRAFRGAGRAASFVRRHVPLGESLMYGVGARVYRQQLALNERKRRYNYRVQTA